MFESTVYDLRKIPYGRRGTYAYLSSYEEDGREILYFCCVMRGLEAREGKLFPIRLFRDGKELSYRIKANPLYVALEYEGGSARLCFERGSILRMEASGAQVVLSPALAPHEIAKDRGDGSWEVLINPVPKLLFCPVRGKMEVKTGYNVLNSVPEDTRFTFIPDEEGKLDLAVHLYRSNAWRLPEYPSVDDCIADLEREFSQYLETAPQLPAQHEKARTLCAYLIWSHILPTDGTELIYMNKGVHRATSSWQQCFHAMGQYRNPRFALELMLSVFRWQDDYGMLPDMLYDSYQSFGGTKPPFYGVALEFLKEFTDFSFASRTELVTLYEGLSKWVYWWLSWRDTDLDGLAQYDTADESGFDDCSFFQKGGPVAAPDLAAYLILSMDHLADLAQKLGRTYEAREWKRRADEMLQKAISYLWNNDRFDARICGSGEWVESDSLITFAPLLLGERLPQEIRDQLADRLSKEGDWLTSWGLAGERLGSAHCHESGWSAGPILAPAQLLAILGLHFSGKNDLAKEITSRYCEALIAENFPMVMNPKTGKDSSEGRWGTRYPNRMPWTAVVFLILGSMYL
ncbi:MAG: hypothetical protein II713_02015 [Clostridia bacterium]|nr:hypothetical protein [Clostridia bacterium]